MCKMTYQSLWTGAERVKYHTNPNVADEFNKFNHPNNLNKPNDPNLLHLIQNFRL
jgi:hypothetical protein